MRLVDAEEIVKRCEDVIRHGVADNAGQHHISAECVMSVVKALPTVDAVPVVHGKWEKQKGIFICSRCWTGYKEQPTMMGKPLFEFCPVCGAKMDGEDDDNG